MSHESSETRRLRFRPPLAADFDRLVEIWTDPEVARLLLLRATGELVGRCGFYPYTGEGRRSDAPEPELAYLLAREHWGAGLATEAAGAALDALFRQHRPARAVALVRPEHAVSRRVLEKVGMREERRVVASGVEMALYATTSAGGRVGLTRESDPRR